MSEWNDLTRKLTWENVKAFLPTMDAAEVTLDKELDAVQCQADVEAAFNKYYDVVEEGIKALHADTSDRNSLTTLQSVFRKSNSFAATLRSFLDRSASRTTRTVKFAVTHTCGHTCEVIINGTDADIATGEAEKKASPCWLCQAKGKK
jgi:hypothetical protein